ncbi:CrcB family protein [Micrococcus sp. M4NT]|uniref:FluC/FEX family fluoride channel n=1 Tax=Micrococcus sp. M4NT TaxID=2957501 RepID=UPI0029AA1D23|nr:CrcB family protein [Micrococcus sp. M4NT]MDX2340884.1 CrcB family protein [Micrococcus sp. M4NT]
MTARRVAEPDGSRSVLPAVALGGSAGAACGAALSSATTAWVATAAAAAGPSGLSVAGPTGALVHTLSSAAPLLAVNVSGSFLLGLLWARSRRAGPQWRPRLVAGLGTGFLGSFTTIASAVALVIGPLQWGMDAVSAVPSGIGGALGAAALLGPVLVVLVLLAALSTAAAVLGLRLGGAPAPDRGAGAA